MTNIKDYHIDELDLEIIKILSVDGRKNKSTIAEDLKRSPNTIIKHITNLEEHGVIKNYGAQIDYEKLGYDIIAIIELTISKGKMLEVENKIAKNPHIFAVYDITGDWDSLIVAHFKDRRDLNSFIKRILSMDFVERSNTQLVLNIVKDEKRVLI